MAVYTVGRKLTNAELHKMVEELSEQVETLKAYIEHIKPTVKSQVVKPVEYKPTPYELEKQAYEESIREEREAYEKLFEEEVQKRVAQYTKNRGGTPANWAMEKIEREIAQKLKHKAPLSFEAHRQKVQFEGIRKVREEEQAKREEGCPAGYHRDFSGMIRHKQTGEVLRDD